MAYVKNTWVTGDVITEGKLNHMEAGIYGALELHTLYDGETKKDSVSGAEVQAITIATPDKVIDNADGIKYFYRLNQIAEYPEGIYITYARDNSADGDRQSIFYMFISCNAEGVVDGYSTGFSNASTSDVYDFTYNSETECWEREGN